MGWICPRVGFRGRALWGAASQGWGAGYQTVVASPLDWQPAYFRTAAACAISDAAHAAGLRIPALTDLDVGQGRTGVPPGEPAVALARAVGRMLGLAIGGVQGYEGHLQQGRSQPFTGRTARGDGVRGLVRSGGEQVRSSEGGEVPWRAAPLAAVM